MKVHIGKRLTLNNPVGIAAGAPRAAYAGVGALYTKTITFYPREGNPPPHRLRVNHGLINNLGLINDGVKKFKMPREAAPGTPVIVSIAGVNTEEYLEVLFYLEKEFPEINGYEINLSCPNVEGIMNTDAAATHQLIDALRNNTKKALIVKLSPNVTDIVHSARMAKIAGADAVTCINTVKARHIDIETGETISGGLSGPCILPIGISAVYNIKRYVDIPIIGVGGIFYPRDAIQYLKAGASAIQLCSVLYENPDAPLEIGNGIKAYMKEHNISSMRMFNR